MEVIKYLLPIIIAIISFITGYYYRSMIERKKTDGIIIIDEADEEGHAGLNMQFSIEYDELMSRKLMMFEVENHLQNNNK